MVVTGLLSDSVALVGPLIAFPFSGLIARGRTEVVSAVLEVAVPDSRDAGLPIRSLLLLLHPTSATINAVPNKNFFISLSSRLLKSAAILIPISVAFPDVETLDLPSRFQYGAGA